MTTTSSNDHSLLDVIAQGHIEIPRDIISAEDFSAWSNNLDLYPFSREGISEALEATPKDSHGVIRENLKTASRTFFKGTPREDVEAWLAHVF